MTDAYVLIQTEQGKMEEIAERMSEMEGVTEAQVVTGPYDIVARVAAPDLDAIGSMIVSEIQLVGGVLRTLTCPVVQL